MPHLVDFRRAETPTEVAGLLGIEQSMLEAAINSSRSPDAPSSQYIRLSIPKKRQKLLKRVVWDVRDPYLRDAHRAFARRFGHFLTVVVPEFPHPAAYGYVRNRSIKDNALNHSGSAFVLRCDIASFFQSIGSRRLCEKFIEIGIPREAAGLLSEFSTIEGALPLGLNASPVLANLVCTTLDVRLSKVAAAHGCVYTRYADDIAISGDTLPPYSNIASIIEEEGFTLSKEKHRITRNGQSHFVTGLSVSDSAAPHVPRPFKRRIRQELYYCEKFGLRSHLDRVAEMEPQRGLNRIDGSVRFIAHIEPAIGDRTRKKWQRILAGASASASYAPVEDAEAMEVNFLVDEGEFYRHGKRHLALCLVTTEQIARARFITQSLLREFLVDPFSSSRKSTLEAKGLHFTDVSEDLRTNFVRLLQYIPYRGYVAFGELKDNQSYAKVYEALLRSMLERRLMDHDRGRVSFILEQNTRISIDRIQATVAAIYRSLEERNDRRPIEAPKIVLNSKVEESAISLPDSLLWIFCRYYGDGLTTLNYLRFERLRYKYRHIINIDTGERFSRRHPIENSVAT